MMKSQICQVIADKKDCFSGQIKCKLSANVKEKLSELIQRRIKELGISKAELAKRTGLSRTYITDLANGTGNTQSGEYRPSPEVTEKLAKHLDLDLTEILGAIGYTNTDADIERIEVETMYFKRKRLTGARRDAFRRIMDMVDRELDALYSEEISSK